MSDSAKTTWYTAPSIGRLGTITRAPEESPTNANHAIEANDGNAGDCVQLKPEQDASSVPLSPKCFATTTERAGCLRSVASGMLGYPATDVGIPVDEVKLLAQGGYNDVWLISFRLLQEGVPNCTEPERFILREPNQDALLPHQIENEAAWLTFMAKYHPAIPVPKVYAYNIRDGESPYIAMEYIQGDPLSSVWKSYSEPEKLVVAQSIADLILDLGEIPFDRIGGLTLKHEVGPTVEGVKLFKGRGKFHNADCYNIGPYSSARDYILACYDKEIYYYTHASSDDIDMSFFDKTPKDMFINSLQETRDNLAASDALGLPEEPFIAVHGDLQGRNIMMRDKRICAVLDWEFAGAYPLSELGGDGVDVLEMESQEDMDEDFEWSHRIADLVEERARGRGWEEWMVHAIVGEGNVDLKDARVEMFPRD